MDGLESAAREAERRTAGGAAALEALAAAIRAGERRAEAERAAAARRLAGGRQPVARRLPFDAGEEGGG